MQQAISTVSLRIITKIKQNVINHHYPQVLITNNCIIKQLVCAFLVEYGDNWPGCKTYDTQNQQNLMQAD